MGGGGGVKSERHFVVGCFLSHYVFEKEKKKRKAYVYVRGKAYKPYILMYTTSSSHLWCVNKPLFYFSLFFKTKAETSERL